MRNNFLLLLFSIGLLSISGFPLDAAFGDAVPPTTLFYTTFAGGPNVHSVTVSYDGAATFSLGAPVNLCTTNGADGISGNPQNSDLLLVGGQGPRINTCSISTGTATPYASPVNVYHLEVSDPTTVYGAAIPGSLARHTINPDGSLSAGTSIILSGHDTVITQLISTPGGSFFYTSSPSVGVGSYGTLTFTGATTATTTQLHGASGPGSVSNSNLPAAHGGFYDPFTGNVIICGDGHITQLDLAGNIVSDRNFNGFMSVSPNFDQCTTDGNGHLFAASNTGHLLFVDYSVSGLVGDLSNFATLPFLANDLDDIAPLVGEGSTNGDDPIGGEIIPIDSAALLLAGAQTSVVWLLPIVIASAGIAVIVLRRD